MSSRHYSYRITVTPTGAPSEGEALRPPFTFEATNHDDIIAIVERARANTGLAPDAAASVAVGLKASFRGRLTGKEQPALRSAARRHPRVHWQPEGPGPKQVITFAAAGP